ncbi:MAG: hypothetical protein NVSMB33_17270 [Ktedonobacteraceae bacterium]
MNIEHGYVCVQDLVTQQAHATPDAIALVLGEQRLSYRELNRRANQLAHLLQALGVHPNTLVGICMEQSLELVVGLLGILKAGGAFVPLDPDYPSNRISFMIEDSQPLVLVTQQHLTQHLPVKRTHVLCLDSEAITLSQQSESEPPHSAMSSDLAYVIYTSGSTGQPKGAQITHKNLLNLIFWHQHAFSVTANDRATQVASIAFDATVWELWPYLTMGACVFFLDQETRAAPVLLRDWLVKHHITITFLPTVLAESVMVLEWPATTSLRFLLTGADTLRRYPSVTLPFALINNYGLTETTVVSTSGQVFPSERTDIPPSIGRPIANTKVYIIDEYLCPVPVGMPGELCIGGEGVGRGFLNRPDLNAQKFIPDPFSDQPNAQMYRTGDVACFRSDGQIEFMGRNDQQIKIRGHRIEPNEITSVLNDHPAVVTSFLMAREDTPGAQRLVAYLVVASGASLAASVLRNALIEHLPDYMIPAAFVPLETLPLTSNGKVDRMCLPAPDATNTLHDAIVASRTPLEERVSETLANLLNIEKVGIDDNFFMLGGHSLLATQLIMRLAAIFGVPLTLRSLFEAPTVRQLSLEIERCLLIKVAALSDDEAQFLLKKGNTL